jgi:glutamate synthase (NADPH) large chain
VRNSGAHAVVEGTGDHCCEYMTGGVIVVLGQTGRNFGAGMSGGVAFVWDEDGKFRQRINRGDGSILVESLELADDIDTLFQLVEAHYTHTASPRAKDILNAWDENLPKFVKVWSVEYRDMLAELAREEAAAQTNGHIAKV